MKSLEGFYLKFLCAPTDLYLSDAVFQAELKALLQPLSINDSGPYKWKLIELYTTNKIHVEIFIPIIQATDPIIWGSVVSWIEAQPGRTLSIRFNSVKENTKKNLVILEKILPLLEEVLNILESINSKYYD